MREHLRGLSSDVLNKAPDGPTSKQLVLGHVTGAVAGLALHPAAIPRRRSPRPEVGPKDLEIGDHMRYWLMGKRLTGPAECTQLPADRP